MEQNKMNEFIHNVLVNSAQMAFVEEAYGTLRLLENLDDVFRYMTGGARLETLHRELEMLEKFVAIQKIRCGDRFSFHLLKEDGRESLFVPKMAVIDFFDAILTAAMEQNESPVEIGLEIVTAEPVLRIEATVDAGGGKSCHELALGAENDTGYERSGMRQWSGC